jgi:DNA-binding response OmpR family regulator
MNSVLVVDDDPSVRKVVTVALTQRGYDVIGVPSGEDCLRSLRGGFRGLILMDVLMPGISGWQTIRALAEAKLLHGSVVCMLTGMLTPNEEAEGLEELVLDYLAKPFDASSLLQMVDEAMAVLSEPREG